MTNETVTTETVTGETDLDRARAAFQRELLVEGLLVETEVPGLYGRSGVFEDIVDGIDRVVIAAGPGDAATRLRFPPVFPRSSFERTDYIASFPNLTGASTPSLVPIAITRDCWPIAPTDNRGTATSSRPRPCSCPQRAILPMRGIPEFSPKAECCWTSTVFASGTNRRSIRLACRRFGCTSS